jgi:hypothetical protein
MADGRWQEAPSKNVLSTFNFQPSTFNVPFYLFDIQLKVVPGGGPSAHHQITQLSNHFAPLVVNHLHICIFAH